ncbi:MAG: hypothetical protein HYX97_00910 [Chloroflexi bacterium]|nr:hypothetical protein [Chloroflexota bacterium]
MAEVRYKCLSCGHAFSVFTELTNGKPDRCPRCGGERLEVNPWLLGSSDTKGLTEEDYYAVATQL